MSRFQLVFRRAGEKDRSEYHFRNESGQPHIDGRPIVDGETYVIRGVDWVFSRDEAGDSMPRFVCTLAAEPSGA